MATNGKTAKGKQLAWVFDLNKCIGCQTCSVACKVLWKEGEAGTEHMWWMTVNTKPGKGTPVIGAPTVASQSVLEKNEVS